MTKADLILDIKRYGKLLGKSEAAVKVALDRCATVKEHEQLLRGWKAAHRKLAWELDQERENAAHQKIRLLHREDVQATLKADRARMALGQRFDHVLAGIRTFQQARAAQWEPKIRSGKAGSHIPVDDEGNARLEEHDVNVDPLVTAVLVNVEMLELVYDGLKGQADPVQLAKLPGHFKDAVIRRLVGMHSRDLAEQFPWLGGQRKVEMVRRDAGQRPVDGTEPAPRLEQVA